MGVNKQETMGIYISYFVTGTKNKYLRKNVSKRCQIILSSCNEFLEDRVVHISTNYFKHHQKQAQIIEY